MAARATETGLAYVLLIVSALCWGANAVAGKLAVGHVSPLLLTQLRWLCASLATLPFAWPYLKRDWFEIRRHGALLMFYGGAGLAFFNAALYSALNHTSTINVVIEQAGMPMVIFTLNFVLLRHVPRVTQLLGFTMTFIGVLVIVSNGRVTRVLDLSVNYGDALMLIAILCYGSYAFALRFKPQIHWLSFITMIFITATIWAIPFTLWEGARGAIVAPDLIGGIVIVYAALFPGLIAQIFFIRSNELIGSNRAGIFFNLVPIFGTFLAVLLVGEPLRLHHVVALALVLTGIALAERRVVGVHNRTSGQ